MKKDNRLGFVDLPRPIGLVRYYPISIHLVGINPVQGMLTGGGYQVPQHVFFLPFPLL